MAQPPKEGERSEPVSRMVILPYDTKSQSRNASCVPLGEEGHEVAKGWTVVRMIMIFLFYLSVLCPVHPFPLRGTSPQGETRDMREKQASHILHVPFRCSPPLVAGATTFPPQAGALWVLSHGAMSLQESIERFILFPGWGKAWRSRIRGSRVAANHQNAYPVT